MKFNFTVFEVVLLIGITQGFFISILIWINKRDNYSKLLLSAILIVFNFLCFKMLLHTTGLWQTSFFRYFPSSVELLIQPLIWCYVKALIYQNFKIRKNQILHFQPFILFFSYSLFVYFSTQQTNVLSEKDLIANSLNFNKIKGIEDILSVLSSVIYMVFGLKMLISYQKWLHNNTSNADFYTYKWLKIIIPIFILLILILAAITGFESLFGVEKSNFIYWQLFFVYIAFIVYFLGFKGYSLNTMQATVPSSMALNTEIPIQSEESERVKAIILYEFEQNKVFLDPDLNIQKLSDLIKINQNTVSQVINQSFKKSFRSFVNGYRIAEMKTKFEDPSAIKYTIIGLAFEAGFNSEASFYRIFKTAEGVSPKTYFEKLER